jgi:hypothetical protein
MFDRRRGWWSAVATIAFLTLSGVLAAPDVARAQPAAAVQGRTLDDLKHRLADFERVTAAQIAEIRQQIAALESKTPVPSTTPAQAESSAPPAPPDQQETFSRDRESVARVNNVPIDPALQGFVSIPGTPARVKIDGYAKLDAIVDMKPAGNPDRFIPSTIPVGLSDAQQTPSTNLHVRQTRINLDFRSPTELGVDFRTFAEIDFFGASGGVDPRMRHFYGQLSNFLVGQTWTTFTDVDAFPDTLDDDGSGVAVKLRQPQFRYTQPLKRGQSLAFAVERPLTESRALSATEGPYNPAPDVIVRYRLDRTRGHLQASSLFRSLGYRVFEDRRTKTGVGASLGGAWKVSDGDTVMGYAAFGVGIARYIENLVGTNSDLDLNDAGTDIEALPAYGGYLAYAHAWPKRLRSTGVFSYSKVNPSAMQPATAFLDSYYVLGNLLWNPVGSLSLGAEYIFGTHDIREGEGAHASRVQFSAKYDFFRKRPLTP